MPLYKRVSGTTLTLMRADITDQDTDAIVNAANSSLLGGGGVDGAIHRAGGPQILEECKMIRATCGECPPGEAVVTGGGRLKCRFVIHTVGPVWQGGKHGEEQLLANAYRNSLRLAAERNLQTIAFPSISTGAYGFPIQRAAHIALSTVTDFLKSDSSLVEVRFIVFSHDDYEVYALLF
ncbi:MAG TPA: O-acetyl-ADP-ribose deacetylase [Bacteroidota bacterium]|nr:O-acetyl-ADP-ribose deacetylase [Bacteroidota bacterium]